MKMENKFVIHYEIKLDMNLLLLSSPYIGKLNMS